MTPLLSVSHLIVKIWVIWDYILSQTNGQSVTRRCTQLYYTIHKPQLYANFTSHIRMNEDAVFSSQNHHFSNFETAGQFFFCLLTQFASYCSKSDLRHGTYKWTVEIASNGKGYHFNTHVNYEARKTRDRINQRITPERISSLLLEKCDLRE